MACRVTITKATLSVLGRVNTAR